MNKFYITMIMMFAFVWASAQTTANMSANEKQISVTAAQQLSLKTDLKNLHADTKGVGRWYNYASTMDEALGGISTLALTYLFPDTQITAMFGTTASTPWVHGAGTVLDPKSVWFTSSTEYNITASDAYTLDSIGILCSYVRNNANTNIVDTLIVEFAVGTNLPTYYFTGMSANYFSDTLRFKALTFTNSMLDVTNKVVVKYPLTAATAVDTTSTGWNYISVGLSTPLTIPAGEVSAITYQFKAGYSYTQNDILNTNNYFTMASYEEQGDDTYPTYTPGDENTDQIIATDSKFNPASGWYGFYIPEYAYTVGYSFENHLVDFLLSVNVGMDNLSKNGLQVGQNRPNPFSGTTTINYNLDKSATVSVNVYNVTGAQIMTISEGLQSAGSHQITLDGTNLPAGVYYYTFTADNNSVTKKMIVY